MSNAEATTSSDRTGTGRADAAPAHNPEAARLRALLEPAVQANRLYLEDVSIIPGSHRVVHVVVDLPQEETGGVNLDVIADISKVLSDVLDNDPGELENLAHAPRLGEVQARLVEQLIAEFYGGDLAWVKDGSLVGLPDRAYTAKPDRGLSGQRGTHWPPPPLDITGKPVGAPG